MLLVGTVSSAAGMKGKLFWGLTARPPRPASQPAGRGIHRRPASLRLCRFLIPADSAAVAASPIAGHFHKICINFRGKRPRHTLKLHSLDIFEKTLFCPVLFFSLICFLFAVLEWQKRSKSKKRIKRDKTMFFRKYPSSEASKCAAAVFLGNLYFFLKCSVPPSCSAAHTEYPPVQPCICSTAPRCHRSRFCQHRRRFRCRLFPGCFHPRFYRRRCPPAACSLSSRL